MPLLTSFLKPAVNFSALIQSFSASPNWSAISATRGLKTTTTGEEGKKISSPCPFKNEQTKGISSKITDFPNPVGSRHKVSLPLMTELMASRCLALSENDSLALAVAKVMLSSSKLSGTSSLHWKCFGDILSWTH